MTLTGWLRTLDEHELADVLLRRPDAVAPPPPTMGDLAQRLSRRESVAAAVARLDQRTLALAEIIFGLGGATREELARRLPELPPAVCDRLLCTLRGAALVWETDGRLCAAGGLGAVFPNPLRLGVPLRTLLSALPDPLVATIAETLGQGGRPGRAALHDAIGAHLTPERVRSLIAAAPPEANQLLERALSAGSVAEVEWMVARRVYDLRRSDLTHPVLWAVCHGLLLPQDWQRFLVPREVGREVLAERTTFQLPWEPPHLATTSVGAGAVERAGGAAATAWLDLVTSVLEHVAAAPLALRQAGGVGVREVRRLAKLLGSDEAHVRLALDAAHLAHLLMATATQAMATKEYDTWRDQPPDRRLADLLVAWWQSPYMLTDVADPLTGRPAVPLGPRPFEPAVPLRQAVLRTAAAIAADRGIVDRDALVERARWDRPLAVHVGSNGARWDLATWDEAAVQGLVADNAVTSLGRALAAGEDETGSWFDALVEAGGRLLPPATTAVALQADLTAVVGGPPTRDLARLLDACAVRESRGPATVWRFSDASVRGWLDAGGTADDLLDRLTSAAARGVPQPLAYLVRDAERRHGRLGVTAVQCCVISDDVALLAEVAAARALRPLGLRLLAPTVLAADCPAEETMRALRGAGYSPVERATDGSLVVTRDRQVRAPSVRRPRPWATPGEPARDPLIPEDALTLARALLAAPDRPRSAEPPALALHGVDPWALTTTADVILAHARQLPPDDAVRLAEAVERNGSVHVEYVSGQGQLTCRDLSELDLEPPFLHAWCHLREDGRTFSLGGLVSVDDVQV